MLNKGFVARNENMQAPPAPHIGLSDQQTGREFSGKGRPSLAALEGIESLVGVSDEGQAHLGFLGVGHGPGLSAVDSAGVLLGDLINGEVRHVDVRAETRLEWCANATQLLPHHTTEEWVVLDLGRATMLATLAADTVLGITQEAAKVISTQPCVI